MRLAVVIAALLCAASAARAEDTRESRYGPTALRPSVSLSGSNYGGPVLKWAGKQESAAPAQAPAPALRPMATPWRQLGAVQPPQPAQQPYAEPRQAATAPEAPMATPWRQLGAIPRQPAVAPPQAPAASAPQIQAPTGYAPLPPTGARTYSVGRQYGMLPDAIPPSPPNGMVFIAPSDDPRPSKKDDEPRHGSAEWLAQAPMDAAEDDDAKSGGN